MTEVTLCGKQMRSGYRLVYLDENKFQNRIINIVKKILILSLQTHYLLVVRFKINSNDCSRILNYCFASTAEIIVKQATIFTSNGLRYKILIPLLLLFFEHEYNIF